MFGLTEFQLFAATLVVVGVPAAIHFVRRQQRLSREASLQSYRYLCERIRKSGLQCSDQPESAKLRAAREQFRSEAAAAKSYREGGIRGYAITECGYDDGSTTKY